MKRDPQAGDKVCRVIEREIHYGVVTDEWLPLIRVHVTSIAKCLSDGGEKRQVNEWWDTWESEWIGEWEGHAIGGPCWCGGSCKVEGFTVYDPVLRPGIRKSLRSHWVESGGGEKDADMILDHLWVGASLNTAKVEAVFMIADLNPRSHGLIMSYGPSVRVERNNGEFTSFGMLIWSAVEALMHSIHQGKGKTWRRLKMRGIEEDAMDEAA